MLEVRLVPDATDHLESMFKAMNECQLLHPDPCDSISEDEFGSNASGDEDDGDDDDEDEERRNGNSLVDQEMDADIVPGQFDDAD